MNKEIDTPDLLERTLQKLRTIFGFTLWGLTTIWVILYIRDKVKGKQPETL